MSIFMSPTLTIVSVLGLALFYALIIGAQKIELIRKICLTASFAALFVGILMGLSFDKAAVGYQDLSDFSFVREYNSSFALGVDGLSYIFLILTLVTFPFLFLAAWNVSKFPKHFFCHLLAMELLLVLTFVTVDLFYFFILFESLLIPMFILIGVWGARTRKIKAAYYFFLYTLFGSLFMLFGMIYLYHLTGSLNYHVLLAEELDLKTQKMIWTCFFLTFAVKMPLFPFHIWLPEAHVEAPTVGSMLLASLLLKLGGYGLLRFSLTFLGGASVFFTAMVATLAIAGVIYGSLSTMRQIDLKRIIAYSSVAHMNLVALGIFSFNRVGIEGSIYLMIAHGVVSAALFFCVGVIYDRTHTRLLRYYGGLVTVMPVFASFFFFFNLANMGFPATPNFVGELLMLAGIYAALSPVVAYTGGQGVVFSAAYSTLLFARVMFGTLKTKFITSFIDANRRESVILLTLAFLALALGLRSDFVITYIEATVWNITSFNPVYQCTSSETVAAAAVFIFAITHTPTSDKKVYRANPNMSWTPKPPSQPTRPWVFVLIAAVSLFIFCLALYLLIAVPEVEEVAKSGLNAAERHAQRLDHLNALKKRIEDEIEDHTIHWEYLKPDEYGKKYWHDMDMFNMLKLQLQNIRWAIHQEHLRAIREQMQEMLQLAKAHRASIEDEIDQALIGLGLKAIALIAAAAFCHCIYHLYCEYRAGRLFKSGKK